MKGRATMFDVVGLFDLLRGRCKYHKKCRIYKGWYRLESAACNKNGGGGGCYRWWRDQEDGYLDSF